ncbi:MAG: hypothetical protein IGS03_03760 [Candidatus Sericytochromatia bacterium]|nr:hypothetical protein [Candidatus Sericytochromatia bacterium]
MQQDQAAYSDFQPVSDLPLLRFYTWSAPTLSIGRFQSLSEVLHERLQTLNIPVVRRPTGGQAILHAGDLTFSLVAPHSGPLQGNVTQSFAAFAAGVICGLQMLGLNASLGYNQPEAGRFKAPSCLEHTTAADICLGNQKLLGAAQVRSRKNLLIQAVIYRQLHRELLQTIFEASPSGTDLAAHLTPVPDHQTLAQCICKGFEKHWGIRFEPATERG